MVDAYRVVLSSAGNREEAQRIARALVERRLAACVNLVGPIESVYRWKEQIEQAAEWLLLIKTTSGAVQRVRDAIRELHSYELPECIEIALEGGSLEYLRWLGEQVK